jgi:hypothetical protein
VHLKVKGKAVPLQAWSGPEGSRKLRFPDFMTTAQEGGKVVILTHRPHLSPGNCASSWLYLQDYKIVSFYSPIPFRTREDYLKKKLYFVEPAATVFMFTEEETEALLMKRCV